MRWIDWLNIAYKSHRLHKSTAWRSKASQSLSRGMFYAEFDMRGESIDYDSEHASSRWG